MAEGQIIQVIGPVVDVRFPERELPEILNAIQITDEQKGLGLIVEAAQMLGKDVVRRRVELMEAEGVRFVTGVTVGADVSADRLLAEHDALGIVS